MLSFLFKNNTSDKNQEKTFEQQELSDLEKRIHEQLQKKNQLLLNNSSADLGLQLKKFFELNQSNIQLIQQYEIDIKNYQTQISYLQKQNSEFLAIVTDLFIQIHKFTKVFNMIKQTLSQYNIHFDHLSSFDKSFIYQIQSIKQKIEQIESFQNLIDISNSQLQNQQKSSTGVFQHTSSGLSPINIQSLKDNLLQIENPLPQEHTGHSNSTSTVGIPPQPSLVQTLPPNPLNVNNDLDSKTKQQQLVSSTNLPPRSNNASSTESTLPTLKTISPSILDKLKIPINSNDTDNESSDQRQLRLKQYNLDFDSNRKAQLADILNTRDLHSRDSSQLKFPQDVLTNSSNFKNFLDNRTQQEKHLLQQNEQLLKQQKNIQEQKQKQNLQNTQQLKKKQNLQNSQYQKQLSNLNKSLLQKDRSDYVQSLNQSKTQNLNQVLESIQNKEKSNSNFSQQETQQAYDQDQATYNKIADDYPSGKPPGLAPITPNKPKKSFLSSLFI